MKKHWRKLNKWKATQLKAIKMKYTPNIYTDVKREEYRAKVPASQRKATEEAARKAIQLTSAHR